MNINRHNYEEFFLLYVDKELTATQIAELELFLQQNPDLQQELDMLAQTVLPVSPDVKFNKDLLYKTAEGIHPENYEEYFLLYVDNELSEAGRQEVEKFVLQHPSLQEAFTVLRATKLEADTIVFGDKASLYRKEKTDKVVPFIWLRSAAAAAVIGLVALLWFSTSDTGTSKDTKTAAQIEILKPVVPLAERSADKKNGAPVKNTDTATLVQEAIQESDAGLQVAQRPATHKSKLREQSANSTYHAAIQPGTREENALIAEQVIVTPDIRKSITPVEPPVGKNPKTADAIAVGGNDENVQIHQAIYTAPVEDEDDRSIYIGGAEINRNKLRGLLKKAAGIFDKKTKKADDDNTVQIASFEIKTK